MFYTYKGLPAAEKKKMVEEMCSRVRVPPTKEYVPQDGESEATARHKADKSAAFVKKAHAEIKEKFEKHDKHRQLGSKCFTKGEPVDCSDLSPEELAKLDSLAGMGYFSKSEKGSAKSEAK